MVTVQIVPIVPDYVNHVLPLGTLVRVNPSVTSDDEFPHKWANRIGYIGWYIYDCGGTHEEPAYGVKFTEGEDIDTADMFYADEIERL